VPNKNPAWQKAQPVVDSDSIEANKEDERMGTQKDLDRIPTGIVKLDQLLGGFPKGRTVLVTGDAGAGKTIFGLQFTNACCLAGLRVAHFATEEGPEDLKAQAKSFGWDLAKYAEKGTFKLIELSTRRTQNIEAAVAINISLSKGNFDDLMEVIPEGTEVLVVDSLGSHSSGLSPREFKDRLDLFIHNLSKRKITTMLILDSATSKEYNDLALFSVYGAIVVTRRENPYTGLRERVLDIIKMRNTSTPIQLLTFDITKEGIVIMINEKDQTRR
jgi:archaeal flagellar protein FlaH